MWVVEKLEPLTDGFTYFELVQKTMNTHTQYMSVNKTVPPQEQFLTEHPTVTMFQKSHALNDFWFDPECPRANFCQGRYGISIPEIGWFLTPRGTSSSISTIVKYRKCTRCRTILLPLMNLSYYRLLIAFTRNKVLRQQVHKTLTHVLCPIMITRLSYLLKGTQLSQVNHRRGPYVGNLWDSSDKLWGIPTAIGSLFHYGRFGIVLPPERGDLAIKDYVVLQKPPEQADCLPPPRTLIPYLILDFTLTHTRYVSSHVHTTGQLTNTRR